MYLRTYLILSLVTISIGMLFFAFHTEWIVLRIPPSQTHHHVCMQQINKKIVHLWWWQHGQWKSESQSVLWEKSTAHTLHYLIAQWLTLVQEELHILKKSTLQSVTLTTAAHEAFISFDRTFLPKEYSIFEQWMFVEGLLKTIRENGILIQRIYFLVNHQPLHNAQLDFSLPWPITGFIQKDSSCQ